jgi:hypothetical protein
MRVQRLIPASSESAEDKAKEGCQRKYPHKQLKKKKKERQQAPSVPADTLPAARFLLRDPYCALHMLFPSTGRRTALFAFL